MAGAAKTDDKTVKTGRILLIITTIIAVAAIGYSIARSTGLFDSKPEPAAVTAPPKTPEEAIAQLEARLKTNPEDAQGWQMLGWAFFETGRFAEAATAYKRAIQLQPDNDEFLSAYGEAVTLAGDGMSVPADAAAAFRKALIKNPDNPRARYFVAVAKDIAGDHKGAIDDWFQLLEVTPAGAPWEENVRAAIRNVGEKNKIDVATRLASLKPLPAAPGVPAVATAGIPGPTPQEMRAAGSLPKGQQDAMIEGMIASLEAKLKANPNNADGWIMLMRSRTSLGEGSKAATAYQSALKAFASDAMQKARITASAKELGVPGA
ncbi:tetratricopeptide repeat protein [Sphingobium boeckii]|uniref:Cytochrome c-type biogenesis protein CcmH n=1 Tax=Sphingobium boeckii TaxID=1082345 RepID=A0A7W9EE66_9SPHN|nr:tetratricopeptide repeat protein [Sphingobium boeckii]MBB5685862.1 cytochrome c-type biogenesis protein CcmH [Sphingobium boeckii]